MPKPSELALAAKWFEEHPSETKYSRKISRFDSSYLKTPEGITRLSNKSEANRVYAEGGFGKVKSTDRLMQATVVKKQTLTAAVTHEFVKNEAKINVDLGIAAGGITLREAPAKDAPLGKVRYVYQELYNLGNPLSAVIKRFGPEERLDLAIQLLLKVDALHRGDLSNSHTQYAHRDIKPNNILVDADGNLTLIDFSFTSKKLYETNDLASGTPEYLPIDTAVFEKVDRVKAMNKIKKTPNYLVDDRIATLRTIYNPIQASTEKSIFNKAYFATLPQPLKTLLDTSTIAPHLSYQRRHESERFLAAALILYKRNGKITQDQIDNIRKNKPLQEFLIEYHKNNDLFKQVRIQRKDAILALEPKDATQLLSKAMKLLIDYQNHLYKPQPTHRKLAGEKYAVISQCLDEIKECKTDQEKLVKIDEYLWENYSILSTAQRREEKGLLNKLMNFFSRLFGHIKGKSLVESFEKSLDKAIGPAHQFYRKATSHGRNLGFFKAQEPTPLIEIEPKHKNS